MFQAAPMICATIVSAVKSEETAFYLLNAQFFFSNLRQISSEKSLTLDLLCNLNHDSELYCGNLY